MKDTWWVKPEQLNDEQKAIVPLPIGAKRLVTGPPGSGKTNLLLLRAKHLSLAGHKNIAIVVFTRALQEFIAAGAQQYAVDASRITTCRRWQSDLLYDAGMDVRPPEDFNDQRQYFISNLNALLSQGKIEKRYQAILLDEGQDYLPGEIDVFTQLSDSLFVVADSRQQIYKGEDTVSYLIKTVGKFNHHPLRYHYRNGHKICTVADSLAKNFPNHEPLVTYCQYDEKATPSSVEHVFCSSLDQQASKVVERLALQLRTYPDELLGVCAPRGIELEHVWRHIQGSPLAGQAILHHGRSHAEFGPQTRICVATAHSMKGLEVRALHVVGTEHFRSFAHQHRLVYTTSTRAKTALIFYSLKSLPPYLEGALQVLQPIPDIPTLSAVFGTGG